MFVDIPVHLLNYFSLTLSVPNFRQEMSSAFLFNKPFICKVGKTFIC